ncbi:MAG: VOC family protein, partial [Candidatus Binatia bacterium]
PGRIEAQIFGMAATFDGWGILDRVTMPALLVRGERSMTLSATDAAKALGHLRRGRLVTAPEATHFIPMEKPEWVVDAVGEFLDAGEPPARLPVSTRGLAHLALSVRNLEEVCDFYREVFGLRIVWQPDPDNVYLSSGRDNLALHRSTGVVAAAGGALDHLGFLVERPALVYAAAEALAARGVSLLQGPKHHRDGSCSLYLKDPAGNVVQVLYTPDAATE